MLRGVIICPDSELGADLAQVFEEIGQIAILRSLDHYPNSVELTRLLRAQAPQVVMLGIHDLESALRTAREIEESVPGTQIVATHRHCEPQTLIELMRSGIREFLGPPFRRQEAYDLVLRLEELLRRKPPHVEATDQLFAFLPSKPGSGASTVAVNMSAALARLPDMHTLLMDFDFNSGMLRFMLKLDNAYSVIDAAEHAADMDEDLWPQLSTKLGNLDVIHAGALNPGVRIEAPQIRHLFDFARRHYRAICVDLSGNMEKYSLETMQEAKQVFLVCTPEIPSLHLAREKTEYLRSMDLGDRMSVILNRFNRRGTISEAQVEEILGLPVQMCIPNDYQAVQRALTAGTPLPQASELGKTFDELARSTQKKKEPIQPKKRRFIEYFSIVPARYAPPAEKKRAV